MNPVYPLSSFVEKNEEDPNLKLYIFTPSSQVSSSSQLAYAACVSTTQHDQRGNHLQESNQLLRHDHQAEKSLGGSSEDCQVISSTCLLKSSVSSCNAEPRPREALDRPRDDNQDLEDQSKPDNVSAKYWMSSKMRLMQKMMINTDKKAAANSDQKPASIARNIQNVGNHRHGKWEITRSCSHGHNNGVRVCSDCNTTTTPLWRSGPQGPKSLCNACGIRQRKARRAMAEAASGGVASEAPLEKHHKEKKSRTSWHGDSAIVAHVKNKSSKAADNSSDSQSEGNVSFDHNFTLRLRKSSSAFGRVFPRDEEEAAILLMELSCGLVHSC